MKYCPKCNCELPDVAMFCASCGTNLNDYAASAPVSPTEPVSAPVPPVSPTEPYSAPVPPAMPVTEAWINPPKKSKAKIIIIISVIVTLIAGVVVAGFFTDWFGLASKKGDTSNVVDPVAEQAKKDEEDKKAVEDAIKAFYGAYQEMDFEKMKSAATDESDITEIQENIENNCERFSNGAGEYEQDAYDMLYEVYKSAFGKLEYEIKSIEKSEDRYIAKVYVKEVDLSFVSTALDDEEYEKEAEDVDTVPDQIELRKKYFYKALDEAEYKEDTKTIAIEKIDDKWLVNVKGD